MSFFLLFFGELALLFFLSSQITQRISGFLLKVTKNQSTSIAILAFFFFPGVVIHELAHFIIATLLFVRTGDIEFVPKIEGDRVKLGSVQIAKTDPFRRALIGVAPVLVGLFLICELILFFIPSFSIETLFHIPIWGHVVLLYVIFQISNTMFSSKKDMEGSIELVITLVVLFVISQTLGIKFPIEKIQQIGLFIIPIIQKADFLLLIPLSIDTLLFLLLRLLSS